MLLREGRAQQRQDRSCINKLLPCLSYLNGTRNPPDSCCDPLKEVIKSDPECLCRMASNDGTKQAENAGINVNEAQQLPGRSNSQLPELGSKWFIQLFYSKFKHDNDDYGSSRFVGITTLLVM
ncbi:hypothetical protein LguiA_019791 [Lonicera macranthoides]